MNTRCFFWGGGVGGGVMNPPLVDIASFYLSFSHGVLTDKYG
jgi:hypothetical protein